MEKEQSPLDKIGKRMPYNVPEGFFAYLEESVMARVADEAAKEKARRPRRRRARIIAMAAAAAAACAALVLTLRAPSGETPAQQAAATDYLCVEEAFNSLSSDDQTYLIEMYEHDIFFEDKTNY